MFTVPNMPSITPGRSLSFAERAEGRPASFIPMVYERVDDAPLRWEYHVLNVDTREQELPDAAALNELGSKGWILAGIVEQRERAFVTYYFARQSA